MDQRKVETLLAVLCEGSFRRAAEGLCCTQSAVTQAMDSLERELGCKILDRNYRGIRLTAAGERLYPFFLEFDKSCKRLMREAETIASGKNAPVRIGTFSSIASTWLPQLLADYQKIHPEISFDVQIGSDSIREWLLQEKIDIALGDELRCKTLIWTPLIEDYFSALIPKSLFPAEQTTITIEELALHSYVMAPLDCTDYYVDFQPKKSIKVNCEDDSVVISMVSKGFGISILPDSCLWNLPEHVRKLKLLPEYKRIIGMSTSDHANKEIRQFANFIKKKI
ncbi:MAG: LysR family transcriptional regulator [Lachnospiraceae bacterium]|nr:LysR family transcriptional regulator [Lachnospiraceae bacterium]